MSYRGLGLETSASSMFRGAAQPRLDEIGPQRRIEPDAPILFGTIGGRQVALVRPRLRNESEDYTIPITMSRLRRALDIEADRAVTPYRPSLVDDVPLLPITYEGVSGTEISSTALAIVACAAFMAGAAFSFFATR